MNKYCVITTTTDNEKTVNKITEELLRKRLVSCVQTKIVNSSYWWNGKIEKKQEYLLQMKTKKALYKEVEAEIEKLHNYDVPEIFSINIENGIGCYLDWIEDETKKR